MLVACLMVLAAALCFVQQTRDTVALRLSLRAGDVFRYRCIFEFTSPWLAETTSRERLRGELDVCLHVMATSATGPSEIDAEVRRVRPVTDGMTMVASTPVDTPANGPEPEVMRVRVTIDEDGGIMSLDGVPAGEMLRRIMVSVNGVTQPPQLQPRDALPFSLMQVFCRLPTGPIAVGEPWPASDVPDAGSLFRSKVDRWVSSIDDDAVVVRVDGETAMNPTQIDAAVTMESKGSLGGTERISRRDGLLIERSLVIKYVVRAKADDGASRTMGKQTITVVRVTTP
ncbi:MAG: hypothetical protein U1E76_22100 [Planctomycetota bacterium]